MSVRLAWVVGAGAALGASVGCGGKVVCEGDRCDGAGGAGQGAASGGTTTSGSTGSGATGGGGAGAVVYGVDPVTIGLSSFPRSCLEPDPPLPEGCPWWSLEVTLPLALLVPGPIDQGATGVQVFMMESGMNDGDPNDCWGGGGNVFFGDIAIGAVGAEQLTVVLSNVDEKLHGPGINGSHAAQRCQ